MPRFQTDVVERSKSTCRSSSTCGRRGADRAARSARSSSRSIDATDGKVALVKVNVDENPGISQAFQRAVDPGRVSPCKDGQVVDGFVGAYPEQRGAAVRRRPAADARRRARSPRCSPPATSSSLRQVLELEPGNEDAIVALGELLVERGDGEEALALLERIPESERTRKVAAAARLGTRARRRLRRHARRRCSDG